MTRYLPAAGLAKAVLICIGLEAVMTLVSMVSTLLQGALLLRLQGGEVVSDGAWSRSEWRVIAVGMAVVLMAAIAGVVFLWYLARVNHNARALGAKGLSATPGWTIGYFFVPIINLYRPYQIVQELWKASAPVAGRWTSQPGSSLVGWWWALHLLDNVANQIVARLNWSVTTNENPDVNQLLALAGLDLGVEVLDLGLCVAAFQLVRKLQERQSARAEIIGEPENVVCDSCGESLGTQDVAMTTCPVCGAKLDAEPVSVELT